MPTVDPSVWITQMSDALAQDIDNQILQSYTTSTATTATVSYPYTLGRLVSATDGTATWRYEPPVTETHPWQPFPSAVDELRRQQYEHEFYKALEKLKQITIKKTDPVIFAPADELDAIYW